MSSHSWVWKLGALGMLWVASGAAAGMQDGDSAGPALSFEGQELTLSIEGETLPTHWSLDGISHDGTGVTVTLPAGDHVVTAYWPGGETTLSFEVVAVPDALEMSLEPPPDELQSEPEPEGDAEPAQPAPGDLTNAQIDEWIATMNRWSMLVQDFRSSMGAAAGTAAPLELIVYGMRDRLPNGHRLRPLLGQLAEHLHALVGAYSASRIPFETCENRMRDAIRLMNEARGLRGDDRVRRISEARLVRSSVRDVHYHNAARSYEEVTRVSALIAEDVGRIIVEPIRWILP